jgi:hypothetical protein
MEDLDLDQTKEDVKRVVGRCPAYLREAGQVANENLRGEVVYGTV